MKTKILFELHDVLFAENSLVVKKTKHSLIELRKDDNLNYMFLIGNCRR